MSDPQRVEWIALSGGAKPKYGVRAGMDSGNKLYVARAHHEGAIVPGKLHMGHTHVYIPYNMEEVACANYEVLVAPPASLSWVDTSGGNIPAHALRGGQDVDGEPYYIGRVVNEGVVAIGKVHPSHRCCYVAYGGKELSFTDFEILVKNAFGRFLNI